MSSPKVVLITGGSSGIGHATALEFAKLGYMIAITGRNEKRLEATLVELAEAHPNPNTVIGQQHYLAIKANFELEDQVEQVISKVIAHFHRLDILVNNAGYMGENHSLLDEEFFQDFQKVLQVNLLASARLIQLAVPHLIANRRPTSDEFGVIINVSSIGDRIVLPATAYCVSKAGLSMLTKTVANSLEGRPVRVLTVSPGPVKTLLCPDERVLDYMGTHATLLGRPGQASEVAQLIVFLSSNKASYMHACTVDVDGGQITKLGSLITEGISRVLLADL